MLLLGAGFFPHPAFLALVPGFLLGVVRRWWTSAQALAVCAALASVVSFHFLSSSTEYLPLEPLDRFLVELTSDPKPLAGGLWKSEATVLRAGDAWRESSARWQLSLVAAQPWQRGSSLQVQGARDNRLLNARILITQKAPPWYELFRENIRTFVSRRLVQDGGRAGPLALAFLLGDERDLSSREEELFRQAGLAHILALSGSHLSLWVAFFALIFRRLPFFLRIVILPLALTGIYCWCAGDLPALMRAWGALVLQSVRRQRGERSDPLEDLGILVVLFGILRPDYLSNVSFLLSLSAMAGLFLALRFPSPGTRCLGPTLALGFWTGAGAFLGSLPLVTGVFGVFQPLGLLLSLPSGFLAAGFLVCAGLQLLTPPGWEGLTRWGLDLFYLGLLGVAGLGTVFPPLKVPPWTGALVTAVVGILLGIGYKRARGTTSQLRFTQRYKRTPEFPRI